MQSPFRFRIAPLVLASLIFMNCLGIYLIAYAQTGLHRLAEYAQSEQADTRLVVSADEWKQVNWIGAEDFVYRGNVYDLNQATVSGKQVLISCHLDKQESSIRKDLQANSENDHSTLPGALKDLFKTFNDCDGISFLHLSLNSTSIESTLPSSDTDLNSVLITVTAPPPRLA